MHDLTKSLLRHAIVKITIAHWQLLFSRTSDATDECWQVILHAINYLLTNQKTILNRTPNITTFFKEPWKKTPRNDLNPCSLGILYKIVSENHRLFPFRPLPTRKPVSDTGEPAFAVDMRVCQRCLSGGKTTKTPKLRVI